MPPSLAPPEPVLDSVVPDLAAELERGVGELWWSLLRGTPTDLSRAAAAVLGSLRSEGPLRVTDLAEREAVSQPSMTCVIQRLEREGLVRRRPDPTDGRAARIEITPVGLERLTLRAARRAAWLDERLATLTPDQRATLMAAVAAVDALLATEATA